MRREAFTLMELLVVIVIIAVLGTIIMGSATYITRVARVKRAEATAAVLQTALYRYRADYNKWPGESKFSSMLAKGKATFTGDDNKEVFDPLRQHNNDKNIRYLDESTLFTATSTKGPAIKLSAAGNSKVPLVFAKRDSTLGYFKVVFDVDIDTVTVSADDDDDYYGGSDDD